MIKDIQKTSRQIYSNFDYIVSAILTFTVSFVIAIALFRLVFNIFQLTFDQRIDILTYQNFQKIFGMIMTLIIALEFRNSIEYVARPIGLIIKTKAIVMIALLVVVRKFIVMDYTNIHYANLLALSGSAFALGTVYWLIDQKNYKKSHHNEKDNIA